MEQVLFRVGLVLLKYSLTPKVRKACPTMYETLDGLKHLPVAICTEQFLIPHVLKLNITENDMEKEHRCGQEEMIVFQDRTHG